MKTIKCNDCNSDFESKSPHLCKDGVFRCLKCQSKKWRKTIKQNPNLQQKLAVSHAKYRYGKRGITLDDFAKQLSDQNNSCGLCLIPFTPESKKNLDHSHLHGYNRKILCNNCNLLLGHAKEDPKILLSAISYLYSYERPEWNDFCMILAQSISMRSHDPSTKVGCVIVDKDNRIVSMGYNGFPKGIQDTPERYANRETKYSLIIHAEANAILFANQNLLGKNCTLYNWPMAPCSRCAGLIINSGIKTVISPKCTNPRWVESINLTKTMFQESGVRLLEI